ncbi:MAG: single-stranded-DNA-specific exonuclease RecJ [Candidatus Omnitrophica bacterium]|nr:single-stranded-DNA-specific exonuclease RecJ [Candidatus Omnitrophota bacterium]
MRVRWRVHPLDRQTREPLAESLGIHPLTAQILAQRGFHSADQVLKFFRPRMADLHSARLLRNVDAAMERLENALHRHERILIWGDYDADGLCSAAVLVRGLRQLGADCVTFIPHRLQDGYGVGEAGVKVARESGCQLVITADCGTNARGPIEALAADGIDVLVIDHHLPDPEESLHSALLINPKHPECEYPFKELCSAGLAYKFVGELARHMGRNIEEDLELAALATVCDVVPLVGENRVLVRAGLEALAQTKHPGLKALVDVSRIRGAMDAETFSFALGPRINASGRMGSAELSLKLLLSTDETEAKELAKELNRVNQQRRRLQDRMYKEALAQMDREINFAQHKVIVLGRKDWHPGVVGVIAGRLSDRFFRPAIVMGGVSEDSWTGSGRSIPGFHLREALAQSAHLLERFGGHKQACGLSLNKQNLVPLRDSINEWAQENLPDQDLVPELEIDGEIPISALNEPLLREWSALGPFGEGNPEPTWGTRGLHVRFTPRRFGGNHVKMMVSDGRVTREAVAFSQADSLGSLPRQGDEVDMVYTARISEWQGESFVQLIVKDMQPSR